MRWSRRAAAILVAAALVGAGPWAWASSHRENPLIIEDPTADLTDVYAFVSPDDPTKVTFIMNVIPAQAPAGGPNFYRFSDNVRYELKIDNTGDAQEDITLRFTFTTETQNPNTFLNGTAAIRSLTDAGYNVRQRMTVTALLGPGAQTGPTVSGLLLPPNNFGANTTPNYAALAAQAVHDLGSGIKVFAGQRDDPFFIDLGATFDLLQLRPVVNNQLSRTDPNGPSPPGSGIDTFAGFNVHSIAIQLPINLVTRNGRMPTGPTDPAAVIGVWATTSRRQPDGSFRQLDRLGFPLVSEVLIPLAQKGQWNASAPRDDTQFKRFIEDPEPARLLTALFNVRVPPAPRADMIQAAHTGIPGLNFTGSIDADMLRINLGIAPSRTPHRLGVIAGDNAGFPNGRRLTDDIVDAVLRVVAGKLVTGFDIFPNNALADGVDQNDVPFLATFPFLATPHPGLTVTAR
jgi:hypothetical protein